MHADAITLKQLRAIVAVADCAGITAAADRLHLTAPAVSMQLKSLETQVGVELFDRSSWRPNAVGRELVEAGRRIDTLLDGAVGRVGALLAGKAGRVVFGVTSTGKYFAPRLIAQIFAAMPEVDVSLVVGNRGDILAGLDEGRIDLAITGRPPRFPVVEAHVLGDHPHVWIASPDHPLAREVRVMPAQLVSEVVLIRETGSGTRILMERFLGQSDSVDQPKRTIEFGSNETIKQAVMAGLGIAFLSAHTITTELEAKRVAVLAVPGTPVVRKWFLVHPRDALASGVLHRVIDFVVGLDGSFLPASPTDLRR